MFEVSELLKSQPIEGCEFHTEVRNSARNLCDFLTFTERVLEKILRSYLKMEGLRLTTAATSG